MNRTQTAPGSEPAVADPALERQGRRMVGPALRLLLLALVLIVPGVVLAVIGGTLLGPGLALVGLGIVPGTFAVALLVSATVARWAARHKLFA